MKVLVIIPAYNEEKNIKGVVEKLKEECPQYDYLIVNDGSKDNTVEVCKKNQYPYLDLPVNLGIGGAVQAGYLYAKKMVMRLPFRWMETDSIIRNISKI